MPSCPNHLRAFQRKIGRTAGHHAPICAIKTPLGEWENMKGRTPSEGEGPVEGVLPVVAQESGGLGVVPPAGAP
jgi:hypothetical protein